MSLTYRKEQSKIEEKTENQIGEGMEWNMLLAQERRRSSKKIVSKSDNRSEFEKDYHRIIGSASFRRLQDKTQVFPLDKSDFIRTRLTHSLEVSSLAKSLGQTVGYQMYQDGKITQEQARQMEDILLCAGLLHDIGNPPFGHFGETVIRDWFGENLKKITYKGKSLEDCLTKEMREDLLHFEGNAQSLRVITRLHYLVDENGMNLTAAVLNTIIKYPVSSTQIDKKSGNIRNKKMGYFYADRDIFEEVVKETGAGEYRHPLVYLLEAADDIAYSTADLEDGFKKGIVGYEKLKSLLENNKYKEQEEEDIYRDLQSAMSRLTDLYERACRNKEEDPQGYALHNWVVSVQGYLIRSAVKSFLDHYDDIMNGSYPADLFTGTTSEILAKLLKETAFEHIFNTTPIIKLEIAASRIMSFFLEEFIPAAVAFDSGEKTTEKNRKLMDLISGNYKKVYALAAKEKSEEERLYLRLLLITDFISGMTDHYAKSLYQELNGIY